MFVLTAPILLYDIISDPFPLLASAESGNPNKARITVVATNGTGSDVPLDGIIIQFPIGSGADSLTLNPEAIVATPPDNWILDDKQTSNGRIEFVFHPGDGHGTLPKGQSLPFVFRDIEVNRKPGTFAVQITEGSDSCREPHCPTCTICHTKFPNGWGEVKFYVDPANIKYGESTTLHWEGPQGATYSIEYTANDRIVHVPEPGERPLANKGVYPGVGKPPLKPEATTVFTLKVAQRIGNEEFKDQFQKTVKVTSPPPRIVKFHGSIKVEGSQQQLTLTWETDPDDLQVTISHLSGLQPSHGEHIIRPAPHETLHSTYTLKASKKQHTVTSTIRIIWTPYKSAAVGESPTGAWVGHQGCAILPDGSRLFCGSGVGRNVSALDPETLAHVPGSPFGVGDPPMLIAVSPDSKCVYVSTYVPLGPGNRPRLSPYDSRDFRHVRGSAESKDPMTAFAVTPDSGRVYVSSQKSNTVAVYDTSNMKLVKSLNVGSGPQGIAFMPRGATPAWAFVACAGANAVLVIDMEKLEPINKIPVLNPQSVAVTPGGRQLYVGSPTGISVFDAKTLKLLGTIEVGGTSGLAPSPDGQLMFATQGRSLHVIDTATWTLMGTSSIAPYSVGLAVSPDGFRVFVLCKKNIAVEAGTMWMCLPTATGGTG
jgi:YVTN family beta-propeller protein